MRQKAFTLIELLIVIGIVSILATMIILNLGSAKNSGFDSSIMQSMTQIKNAVELQYNNEFTYAHICDDGDTGDEDGTNGNAENDRTLFENNPDFVRTTQYINERRGVVVCRDTSDGWAVASSLNKGGCWCVDFQGNARKFNLGAGQVCGDVLTGTVCP